jgi:hypothetical protein
LRSAKPVLGNPANRHRAVPLTYDQFRFAFANAVSEEEARELYDTFVVPASGVPLFQAAAANLNPWSEAKVDTQNPDRGPMLMVSGEKDNIAPRAISQAAYKSSSRTLVSPSSSKYQDGAMPSRSTAVGEKLRTSPWLSSSASCKKRSVFVRAWRDDHSDLDFVGSPTFPGLRHAVGLIDAELART